MDNSNQNISSTFLLNNYQKIENEKNVLVDISWKSLNCTVTKNNQCILNNSTGYARHGEILAIMGATGLILYGLYQKKYQILKITIFQTFYLLSLFKGSGKTTLLNCLTGRIVNSRDIKLSGQVLMNNESFNTKKNSKLCALVMQNDILMQTLTPRESLQFSADLRLSLSQDQKSQRVDEILNMLQLESCQNTRIGDENNKGISGGEKKRTSIGVELVSDPSMIFLDEPTSGLDSFTAYIIVKLLKDLTKKFKKTVVFTIHSPSSDIFNIFDRLLLLRQGETVFQGAANQVFDYFEQIGYKIPLRTNPSDYFMSLLNSNETEQSFNFQNYQKFLEPEVNKNINELLQISIPEYSHSCSNLYAFQKLTQRSLMNYYRNDMLFKSKLWKDFFMTFLICSIYYNTGNIKAFQDENLLFQTVKNMGGCLFLITNLTFQNQFQGVILNFPVERALFLKEQDQNVYNVSTYYAAKVFVELPFIVIIQFINMVIVFYLIGVNNNEFENFLIFVFMGIIIAISGNAFGLMMGSLFSDFKLASAISPLLIQPLITLGGFIVNIDTLSPWISWIPSISPFKYFFQVLMLNQYKDNPVFLDGFMIDPLQVYNYKQNIITCIWIIVGGFVLGYSLIGLIFLKLLVRKLN